MGVFARFATDTASGHPVAQVELLNGTVETDRFAFFLAFDATTGGTTGVVAQPSEVSCGGAVGGRIWQSGISTGRQLLLRDEDGTNGTLEEGWIDVPWGQSPEVGERIAQKSSQFSSAWHPSEAGVYGQHPGEVVSFRAWGGGAREDIWKPGADPDGLPVGDVRPLPATGALIEVGTLVTSGAWAWSSKTGLVPILRKFGDTTQGSGAVGSDGKDLVWIQGAEKPANIEAPYTKIDVMAAPFSFSVAQVAAGARRLKSAREATLTRPFVVGCGHAARNTFSHTPPKFTGVEVVRLSDGASWLLIDDVDGGKGRWGQPLFLTCDELFVGVSTPEPYYGLARVRLDTLGPPTPSD